MHPLFLGGTRNPRPFQIEFQAVIQSRLALLAQHEANHTKIES